MVPGLVAVDTAPVSVTVMEKSAAPVAEGVVEGVVGVGVLDTDIWVGVTRMLRITGGAFWGR